MDYGLNGFDDPFSMNLVEIFYFVFKCRLYFVFVVVWIFMFLFSAVLTGFFGGISEHKFWFHYIADGFHDFEYNCFKK